MKRLMLIDGSSVLYRAFFALPPLMNSKGIRTNAVYGFMTMLFKVIDDYKPDYIAVAFDVKAPTFRHKEYDAYKATREKMPDELSSQIPILHDILSALNIKIIEMPGFEADDILGTVSRIAEENGYETYIVTGDKDSLQLVSEKTRVILNKKGMTDVEVYDLDLFKEKYGITPEEFIDLKGLMGDKSDNIPGVPGIGEKTALELIKEYGSIDKVIENVEKVKNKRVRESIAENMDRALLSKRLSTIVRDIPLDFDIGEYAVKGPDNDKIRHIFEELEFKSLLNKIPAEDARIVVDKVVYKTIDNVDDFNEYTKGVERIAISYRIYDGGLAMAALSNQRHETVFLPLYRLDERMRDVLYKLLSDGSVKKLGHDLKGLLNLSISKGFRPENISFDSAIAAYLLNATESEYTIRQIAKDFLNKDILDDSIFGKGRNRVDFHEIDEETLNQLLGEEAEVINESEALMKERLDELFMDRLFNEIEMPLIIVLADMECTGFNIDRDELLRLDKEFTEQLSRITEEIYRLAGEEFNINSPKQLSHILFEKLNLPVIKKTKTGYSTDAEVLEELASQHDIVARILEYRQISKLKSTYIDGFIKLTEKSEKIHTSFNQTVTATGRISSTEPNLQNIPIRTDMGRQIRRVFIPSDDDHMILSADYSQIELRVLAHLSGDENLINSFISGEDIHTRTASEVFNVPLDKVTSEMRRSAKAVNFGIVYGISDFGLARDLRIPREVASEYIKNYFKRYPRVKEYLDECVKKAKEVGYVTTIMNRRRYIPEITSKNRNIRLFGERIAMNTPIQGSAADIIKIAMVNVHRRIEDYKSRLILQVHDELIFDVIKNELEEIMQIVKQEMENALLLKVPLIAEVNYGKNWYDAK
ncbi:MAG: DNA polymerase I [Thermoanaerobacteraceae bacterium]|nr:DNA polymerase I [Thermoanaerobacteraceae bacterium]